MVCYKIFIFSQINYYGTETKLKVNNSKGTIKVSRIAGLTSGYQRIIFNDFQKNN